MGVREGLLALLHVAPSHGYQLRGDLEAAVAGLWTVNIGQIYTTLQRLERDGLVVAEGDADADGKVPYRLTDAGRADVRGWMTTAQPRRDDVRDELVLKVLLARTSGLVDAQVVIDRQREATMQALQGFTRRRADLDPVGELEELLALDRLALRARAELDWLDLVEQRLANAPPAPPPTAANAPPPTTSQTTTSQTTTTDRDDRVPTATETA